jgi:hypothetical protein
MQKLRNLSVHADTLRDGGELCQSCRACCRVCDPRHVIRITAATMITQVTTL